jgi:acetoin utilization protein AcuB
MLIKEIMHGDVISVTPQTKLCEAYKIMNENKIRHLPVLENEKLVGIVTDRDLRYATSKLAETPFDPDAEVAEVMTKQVITAHPEDPIETAARIMRDLKISSLVVVENERVKGIVTGIDLLDALLLLTGVRRPSGRLDVRLTDRAGELAKLTALLAEKNINIHSVLSYHEKDDRVRVVLRLNTMEIRNIAEELCALGIEVIWPVHVSCSN